MLSSTTNFVTIYLEVNKITPQVAPDQSQGVC
jgi:hypothetical protein